MPRTRIRQDITIARSVSYDDNVAPSEANFETAPVNIEEDLNNLRSQISNLLDGQVGAWFDTLNVPSGGSQRGVNNLNTDLNELERKKFLCRTNILVTTTVGVGENWAILSSGGGQTPSDVIAIALSQDGAVSAQTATSGAGFAVHELDAIAGPDALNPKNICVVRDVAGKIIESSGRDIFALLQAESTAVDGIAFDDGTNRGKLSFVRANATFTGLETVPVADIEGVTFKYNYVRRNEFESFPEDCFLSTTNFVDHVAAAEHRTLDQLVHDIAEDSFTELEYTGNRVNAIRVYTDGTKTTKIREQEFTYTGNRVTTIVTNQYDAAGAVVETFTETFAYTGNRVDDIAGVLT